MKRVLCVAAILVGCGGQSRHAAGPGEPTSAVVGKGGPVGAGKAVEGAPKLPEGEDVLAEVLAMNSERYGRPSSTFRSGHVTKGQLSPQSVQRTKNGFVVSFPSKAPIATPTVYKGMVMVSGGFQSREYYAFDARNGQPIWRAMLDDDGPSSSACAEGICVFNTESCTVFAVASESGEQLWSWWLGDPLTSTPTIANGLVFTSYPASQAEGGKPRPENATHALIALELKTGKIVWQKWLDSDVMTAPVAAGGFVYAATFGGTLLKVEQKTGAIRYAIRARATSAPVVVDVGGREQMYFTRRVDFADGQLSGDLAEPVESVTRMDDNHPKERFSTKGKKAKYLDAKVQSTSAYGSAGKVHDAANGFGGGAPASANAKAAVGNIGQTSVSTMQAFQGSRVLHLGDRNVNTMGDEVLATDSSSGKTLWSHKLTGDAAREGGFLATAPMLAGNSVVVATLDGKVLRLDPKNGKLQAWYPLEGRVRSQPVADGGWIYIGTDDGKLVAINTKDPKVTGWPTWGGDAARSGARR